MLVAIGISLHAFLSSGNVSAFGKLPATIAVFIAGAYAVMMVPSVVYALCMESVFRVGIHPTRKLAIAISSALGLIAGGALDLTIIFDPINLVSVSDAFLYSVCGLITGFTVGGLISQLERRAANQQPA